MFTAKSIKTLKVGVFYWLDGSLGYALSGELERQQLLRAAEAVHHGLNP